MTKWWLDLYTIPLLKVMLKAYAIVLAFALLCMWMMPGALFLNCFTCFYIAYVMKKNHKSFFAANIEFHKTHVPLKELRSVYLKDAFILFFAQMACYISIFSLMFTQKATIGPENCMMYMALYIASSSYPFLGLLGLKKGTKPVYSMLDESHKVFSFFSALALIGLVAVTTVLLLGTGFGFLTLGSVVVVAILSAWVYFAFRAVFHLEKRKGSPKTYIKYTAVGCFSSLAICFLFALVTRPLIHASWVHPDLRYIAFAYEGPFAPELQIDEAKEFLSNFDADYQLVLSKTPGAEQIHVSELLPHADSHMYYEYVSAIKPTKANMVYILEQMNKKERHGNYDVMAAQVIVNKWPKKTEMPKHLLARYMKKQELPASARIPAAQNTSVDGTVSTTLPEE